MNNSERCVKKGRMPNFWISPEDCRRLCKMMENMPEPDGCHVRLSVEDSGFPELLLRCKGHCDTPDPIPAPPDGKCCLKCRQDDGVMIIECSCHPK
jgi:hypothetical protein